MGLLVSSQNHLWVGQCNSVSSRLRCNAFISPIESVYWHSFCGKLEVFLPLRKLFNGDSQTCLPVAVHDQSATPASVNGIVLRVVRRVHRTASATPFARMVGIDITQWNSRLNASYCRVHRKHTEWDKCYFSVGVLSFICLEFVQSLEDDS